MIHHLFKVNQILTASHRDRPKNKNNPVSSVCVSIIDHTVRVDVDSGGKSFVMAKKFEQFIT